MPYHPTSPSDRSSPPQFGLKILFVAVAVICIGLVMDRLVSPYVLGVLALLVVTVGAHLAASGLGTRLRDTADERRRRTNSQDLGETAAARPLTGNDFAPTTELSGHRSLGRIVILAPIVGGFLGGGLGGWGMANFLGAKARLANVSVAALAAGVLGAIGSFLLATLLKTLFSAHAEAWRHDQSSCPPPADDRTTRPPRDA